MTRVCLYDGDPVGTPKHVRVGLIEGRSIHFGHLPGGTWTVWIDTGTFRPVVLRGVTTERENQVDLGNVVTNRGAGVRIRALRAEGASPPVGFVSVSSTTEPIYHRYGRLDRDGASIRVGGLGPGRFRVYSELGPDRFVESDGAHDAEVTLGLGR